MNESNLTPVKAIRAKCLECCCDQPSEVKKCELTACSLHKYRMGKNPNRKRAIKKNIEIAQEISAQKED